MTQDEVGYTLNCPECTIEHVSIICDIVLLFILTPCSCTR